MSNNSRLNATIFFVFIILIAYVLKPRCWFNEEGELRPYGLAANSTGKNTLFTFYYCMMIVAILSYLIFTVAEHSGFI